MINKKEIDSLNEYDWVLTKLIILVFVIIGVMSFALFLKFGEVDTDLSHKADRVCVNETNVTIVNMTEFIHNINTDTSNVGFTNYFWLGDCYDNGIRIADLCIYNETKEVCTIK